MSGIDSRFYYLTAGLLTVCTIVGLVVAFRFQREVNDDLAPPTEKDLFDPLERAYYSGLMREEEFLRIQESMARQKGEAPPTSKPKRKPPMVVPPPAEADHVAEASTPEEPAGPITPTGDSDPGPAPG